MSMYCRITGKSRGLPKPNYFPLLPPISPADAKKLCRITGKTVGLPATHQYIPIPLLGKGRKSQTCPVTGKSLGQPQHHFIPELPGNSAELRHLPVSGYRYVVPVLDPTPPALQDLLAQDVNPDSIVAQYVYTLDEKSCGLVLPGAIEAAVRKGEVSSIMLADNKEKLAIKLLEGTQITIKVQEMTVQPTIDIEITENCIPLLDGQGPTKKAIHIVEKKKKKAAAKAKKKEEEMNSMTRVFIEKEIIAEKAELESIIEKKPKEEIKIKLPEIEINGILKHNEPENSKPKIAKKVTIDKNGIGDEKIKMLKAIRDIYSNGDITNDDEDISEIEDLHIKSHNVGHSVTEKVSENALGNKTRVLQGTGQATQQQFMQSDEQVTSLSENIKSASAETATEKLLKQATNEKIKTLKLQQKMNGEMAKDEFMKLQNTTSESAMSQSLTAELVPNLDVGGEIKEMRVRTENTGKLSNHEVEEASLLDAINIPTSRVSRQLTGSETAEVASSSKVLQNNTGDISLERDQCNDHVTPLSNDTEKLQTAHERIDKLSVVVNHNGICSDGTVETITNGIVNHDLQTNGLIPTDTISNVDLINNEKIKVLAAMQEMHKSKGKSKQTTQNEINNTDANEKKKEKVTEPIKQIYKSNGSSVQLFIEPWNENSEHEVNREEHVTPLPEPITIPQCTEINVDKCEPGIIKEQPSSAIVKTSVSLPPAPATCVVKPPPTPDTSVLKCIWEVAKQDPEVLEKTANAVQVLQPKHADKVASLQDILKLTKNLEKGTDATLKWGDDVLHGKNVYINRDKSCFVPGLKINGNFIPGQTIDSEFVAGLTVKTITKIGLIPGCVMNDGGFVAGINKEGKFISGQIFNTGEKEEFLPGQTIMTPDGPRFVPGQVAEEQFVPGLIVETPAGPRFIQGQSPEPGEFRPGQVCYKAETGQPIFVPGQTVVENGEPKFIPGRTLAGPEGPQFVPGREVTDGKSIFVPGISSGDGEFIPGTVIDTPSGEQFVEGRVLMSYSGKTRFVPGVIQNNKFSTFKTEEELKTHPKPMTNVPYLQDVAHTTVYGHMIQKPSDVQFYPEGSILPTKNVVRSIPGQLVKNIDDDEEPSFVPGMMIDNKFVAGQMVRTADGTKFVPGQLVKNKVGTKFVPGQTLDDGTFVPGQVVDDKFVPGQIVQTAAGPTFIPGQVISTPEEGARFVPGRVVETSQGPHFVPGRVIEDGSGGVAFIPGRVIDTSEGPRFVAPDLESSADGTVQYSMQSFEVSPEELQLLDQQNSKSDEASVNVDSTMLRQLARAGISIAQKTLPDVYICPVKNLQEIATHITERLKLPEEAHAKMTTILQKVAELGHNISTKTCENKNVGKPVMNSKVQKQAFELIESAIRAALLTANKDISLNPGEAIIQEMSHMLEETLPRRDKSATASSEFLLKALYEIVSTPATMQAITSSVQQGLKQPVANKVEVLKDLFGKQEGLQEKVAKISTVLKKPKNHLDIGKAFKRLSIGDPELVDLVVAKVGEKVDSVSTEKQATSTLQNSIVSAVRESSERQIFQILDKSDVTALKHLILQAVGLARALGLNEAAEELTMLLEDSRIAVALTKDRTALEILQRLTLMKKLSESRPAHAQALGNLSSSSRKEDARYLKQLVRESEALLTAVREEEDSLPSDDEDYSYTNSSFNSTFDDEIINRVPIKIKSSHDIPASLFHALVDCQKPEQLLFKLLSALGEDRLYSYDHACVILKNNVQAVIPKESSRSVLTGKASYTMIDEKGVRQFGAMDVFSALNMSKPIALKRFSLYSSGLEATWGYATELPPVIEDEDISYIPHEADTSVSQSLSEDGLLTSASQQNLSTEMLLPVSASQSVSEFNLGSGDISNMDSQLSVSETPKSSTKRKVSIDIIEPKRDGSSKLLKAVKFYREINDSSTDMKNAIERLNADMERQLNALQVAARKIENTVTHVIDKEKLQPLSESFEPEESRIIISENSVGNNKETIMKNEKIDPTNTELVSTHSEIEQNVLGETKIEFQVTEKKKDEIKVTPNKKKISFVDIDNSVHITNEIHEKENEHSKLQLVEPGPSEILTPAINDLKKAGIESFTEKTTPLKMKTGDPVEPDMKKMEQTQTDQSKLLTPAMNENNETEPKSVPKKLISKKSLSADKPKSKLKSKSIVQNINEIPGVTAENSKISLDANVIQQKSSESQPLQVEHSKTATLLKEHENVPEITSINQQQSTHVFPTQGTKSTPTLKQEVEIDLTMVNKLQEKHLSMQQNGDNTVNSITQKQAVSQSLPCAVNTPVMNGNSHPEMTLENNDMGHDHKPANDSSSAPILPDSKLKKEAIRKKSDVKRKPILRSTLH